MFTIFGSQPARAQEHEKSTASRNRRIVWTTKQDSAARSLFSPVAGRLDQFLDSGTAQPVDCATADTIQVGGLDEGGDAKKKTGENRRKIGGFMCNAEGCACSLLGTGCKPETPKPHCPAFFPPCTSTAEFLRPLFASGSNHSPTFQAASSPGRVCVCVAAFSRCSARTVRADVQTVW